MNDISNVKTRHYSFVTYANPATVIDNLTNVCHCFAILHDKDKSSDGSSITPHYHLLVVFKSARYYSSLRKICKSLSDSLGINTFCEPCHSLASSVLYVLHQDEKSLVDVFKHCYAFTDAISDNPSWWEKAYNGTSDLINMEFVQDLLVESPIKMAYKYGRDYIRNYSRYSAFREQIYALYGGDYSFLTDDAIIDGASNINGFKISITNIHNSKENI